MSSRSSSPTPSDSSSGSQPGQGGEDSALRLAQLEALLNASLGYDPPDHSAQPDDEPPNKKRKHLTQPDDAQDVVVEKPVVAETGPTEIAFRLFSTQKTPQTVVIDEEDVNEVVEDPRIRDVADEPRAVVKQRAKNIGSVALSGETILAQSSSQPPSRFPPRLSFRLSSLKPTATAPPLAYLKALLHPSIPPTTKPNPKSKRSQRKARQLQTPHLPFPARDKVMLKVVPIKGVPARAEAGPKAGRKRLSKERRVVQRKRDAKEMVRRAMEAVEPGA